jgi:ABC-2 type transport system ATP-binding protein
LKVEVAPEQVTQAQAILERIDHAKASVERDVLTVSGVTREGTPDMLAALVNGGVRVYRLEPDEPTLEDVYFALHKS